MLRAALLLLTGNAMGSTILLAKSVIVARVIPVEDYGIASTLALTTLIVEMAMALGMAQQIIVHKDGNDPRFMAAMQGFQVLRGTTAAVLVFLVAAPLANFLNVPEATWGYQMMALLPLLGSLHHMDIHRLNRQMQFGPMILAGFVPGFVSILLLWPLSLVFDDWRIMLASIQIQAVLGLVMTHLVARRPYRLALDRQRMTEAVRFGWPIMINGVLLFLVFNGDRLIVGRELGMGVLGIFAMGVTLTLTPTLVLAKSTQTFFLPQLSHADRGTPAGAARFAHLAMVTMQVALLNGILLVLGTVLVGDLAVHVLLGEKYASLTALLAGLAAVHALRVFKTGGTVVALSKGRTGNAMFANLVRVACLPIAWALLLQGGGVNALIAVAIVGEAGGYALSLWLVRRRVGVSLRPLLLPMSLTFLLITVSLLPGPPDWLTAVLATLSAVAVLASMDDLGRYALRRFRGTA